MQPYQEAGEAIAKRKQAPVNALRTVGTIIGGGAALRGSGAMLKRIIPFLNDYIPDSLARKGLEKIDPRLGKFVDHMTDAGHNFTEVKDVLKHKVEESMALPDQKNKENEPAKENRNIIEKYSPELNHFIMDLIKKGFNPLKAAGEAQTKVKWHHKFKDVIKKMEKDYKMPWSQIVESTYGNMMDPMVTEKMKDFEMGGQAGMNQPQGQPMQGQTQAGDKWARFDDAVSKINQYLGG